MTNLTESQKTDLKNLVDEFLAYRAEAPSKCEFWPASRLFWNQLPLDDLLTEVIDGDDLSPEWSEMVNDVNLIDSIRRALADMGYHVDNVPEVSLDGTERAFNSQLAITFSD